MIISSFTQMKHPSYSPELAPCDFFLVGRIKKKLRDTAFRDKEELSVAI
jgi:hypothetical protein